MWCKFLQFLGYPSFILIHCSFCLEQGVTDPQTLRAVSRFCTYRSLDPSMCAINAMYIIIYAPPFVIIDSMSMTPMLSDRVGAVDHVSNYRLRQGSYVMPAFVCLFVCKQDYSQTTRPIWTKFCMRVSFRPKRN